MQVIADGLVIEAFGLVIDEASLTGESDPMHKGSKDPWCRSGTQVGALHMIHAPEPLLQPFHACQEAPKSIAAPIARSLTSDGGMRSSIRAPAYSEAGVNCNLLSHLRMP